MRFGLAVSALRFRRRRHLREQRRIRHPFVALVSEEKSKRHFRARTREPHERHRAMRIFDCELQCGPHLMRIERAVARLILPARVFLDESRVADLAPIANARGVPCQIIVVAGFTIVGRAITRKAHRNVGVAFARAKAVAKRNNQHVAHFDIGLQNFAPADLDFDAEASGVGHLECDRLAARLFDDFAARFFAVARGGQPPARQFRCFIEPGDFRNDAVALWIDVIGVLGTAVPVLGSVPAHFTNHRRRPAFVVAELQSLFGREDRRRFLFGCQRPVGCPVHFAIGGVGEKPEGIFDAPFDHRPRMCRRHSAAHRHGAENCKRHRTQCSETNRVHPCDHCLLPRLISFDLTVICGPSHARAKCAKRATRASRHQDRASDRDHPPPKPANRALPGQAAAKPAFATGSHARMRA